MRERETDVRTVASCSGSCRFRIPKPVNMRRMKMEVDFTDTSGCSSTGILHVGGLNDKKYYSSIIPIKTEILVEVFRRLFCVIGPTSQ